MKELSFDRMEKIQGGASFWGCIGGSAFTVGIFVAAAVRLSKNLNNFVNN